MSEITTALLIQTVYFLLIIMFLVGIWNSVESVRNLIYRILSIIESSDKIKNSNSTSLSGSTSNDGFKE